MRVVLALICLIGVHFSAHAGQTSTTATLGQSSDAVMKLSRLSGIPEQDLAHVLADCNANQQSLYFCAWRDQLAEDIKLRQLLERKILATPHCKRSFEAQINAWERSRNRSCDESAKKQWGEGSMRPTASTLCKAKATERMNRHMERARSCKIR